jgi:hypothetical protein
MARIVRRFLYGQCDDAFGDRGLELRDPRGSRLVAHKSVHALGGEPLCQRQTQVLDLPVSRMIAFVPTPSALNNTICARRTCF